MEGRAQLIPEAFFKNIPMFSGLTRAELSDLLRVMEGVSCTAGERLFSQGEPADGLYVVERGEVEVMIRTKGERELVLAHLGNGSVIGEMALIAGRPRSASVIAVSPTVGYFLPKSQFTLLRQGASAATDKIILAIARTLEERRHQLQQRIDQALAHPKQRGKLLEQSTKELIARVRKA